MKLIFVLVLAFVCLVYGHNINAIVRFNAKTYAFDGFESLDTPPDNFVPSAFEIVGGVQTNVFSLSLPNTSAVPESSIVIGNFLYQFSGAYGSAVLSKYSLPFTTNPVLPTSQAILANQVQGIPAIFNVKDNIAFALLSRYLTLIDLSNLNSRDSVMAAIGTGKFPGCLVYNQKNQKVYYFQTNYCFAGYCQHIYEFKVNLNTYKLNPLDETFTPNYTATFNDGSLRGCDIDLDNNNIWCLHAKKERLFKFPISNLNSYTSIKLPPGPYTSGNVAFNFNTNRAYVSISNSFSYTINEINLLNGNVPRSGTFSGGAEIESMTIANNALLLGFRFKGLRQMSSINLANLNDNLINLYV